MKNVLAINTTTINFLIYTISNGVLKPDADRLDPLKELPIPKCALRKVLGLCSYYSQWISKFLYTIKTLILSDSFPLNCDSVEAVRMLKEEIESAFLHVIEKSVS